MVTSAKKTAAKPPVRRRVSKSAVKKVAATPVAATAPVQKIHRSIGKDFVVGVGRRKTAIARVRGWRLKAVGKLPLMIRI